MAPLTDTAIESQVTVNSTARAENPETEMPLKTIAQRFTPTVNGIGVCLAVLKSISEEIPLFQKSVCSIHSAARFLNF